MRDKPFSSCIRQARVTQHSHAYRAKAPTCSGSAVSLSANKQSGQVLAEFLVTATFVLIPCFILVLTMGKYLESKQKTEVAARYVAWERTVWQSNSGAWAPVRNVKSDEELRVEAQTRVFGKREQRVHSDRVRALSDFEMDPLLNYHYAQSGDYEPIARAQGTSGSSLLYLNAATRQHSVPGATGAVDSVVGISSALPFPSLNRFDLAQDGAHTGTVSLSLHNPARMSELASLDLRLDRSVTLVTDSWNAGGPAHVKRRVEGLAPLGMFEPVASLVSGLPSVGPLRVIRRLDLGYIDVDQVPAQYLE